MRSKKRQKTRLKFVPYSLAHQLVVPLLVTTTITIWINACLMKFIFHLNAYVWTLVLRATCPFLMNKWCPWVAVEGLAASSPTMGLGALDPLLILLGPLIWQKFYSLFWCQYWKLYMKCITSPFGICILMLIFLANSKSSFFIMKNKPIDYNEVQCKYILFGKWYILGMLKSIIWLPKY